MIVRVDPDLPLPVSEQLRAQIERLIVSGQLAPGTALPPIRHLAADLDLARGTVGKVYEVLARDGWVRAAGRHGTVVQAPPAGTAPAGVSDRDLAAAADRLAVVVRQLGLPDAHAHDAVEAALRRLPAPQDRLVTG
ncbi:GntR family transcriptional regulator [Cellulomonas marina]|uniref:DNA-binding transcriptional regulator YhcF, GntR family n=1 Tax=Cellulomonas marina TaxID=988821 RepID=A0A1I0WWR1_9CELL|nr:GntR family transcriptional regulator [Cellulomonas marina]GIG30364.1 hypothetical protein Cma02nite_29640 [Cellulomonas marina]SFA92486.1 DNA-binding transcriptional regulator YhcF, GntR family [Cellulomonas marina]